MSDILGVQDRATLLANLRAELVGPNLFDKDGKEVCVTNGEILLAQDDGPIFVKHPQLEHYDEVLYERNEGPARKYGVGVLHPDWSNQTPDPIDQLEENGFDNEAEGEQAPPPDEESKPAKVTGDGEGDGDNNDPDVTPTNRYKQSSMGISFCVNIPENSLLTVELPSNVSFDWQLPDSLPTLVNGLYRPVSVKKSHKDGQWQNRGARRCNAFPENCRVEFSATDITKNRYVSQSVTMTQGSPLRFDVILRARHMIDESWLITITLRNQTATSNPRSFETMLFQCFFNIELANGASFLPYPDPPLATFDDPERESLKLLYSQSKTWGIGHNCAAGWTLDNGKPTTLFADVFPVCETPSMTPDVVDRDGLSLQFSMRDLAELDGSNTSSAWQKLELLESEYRHWIKQRENQLAGLDDDLKNTGTKHLDACLEVCDRILRGIDTLKHNQNARIAFRLANKAMMLQQIATKVLPHRELVFDKSVGQRGRVLPKGDCKTPYQEYELDTIPPHIGNWRAFQLAFLLMSISDFLEEDKSEITVKRENVELIWFPTGGGKTEAYLGVAAYSMFLARLDQGDKEARDETYLPVDGTNILMRYTLRMLTTQQFQRASALICAMECLRKTFNEKMIAGGAFSLGLWIGGTSTPNKNKIAQTQVRLYKNHHNQQQNNPLVLTECPWCRAEIGRANLDKPNGGWSANDWKHEILKGIIGEETPQLCCSDIDCPFSDELPILVVDEQIYKNPPSLVIATVDKFAVITYRPDARAIFGRDDEGEIVRRPPFLIIQDETHLISGPLGTMYGLYESVIDVLCSTTINGVTVKPKIICSTATIRGAKEQLKSIFARESFTLFPAPGIDIADSFFGCYAYEDNTNKLQPGRMYVGIHASNFVSAQTTQVRVFSSILVNVENRIEESRRDPWWTILSFYNSLRELGGARTLFQGDIRSRMKFLTHRDNLKFRKDPYLEELSSRLRQDEIVGMLDQLNTPFPEVNDRPLDVCLASNIIEVGVDIDRLSLMAVNGQPKNTAQYIQVTGRVGRRWWERPGLILTIYSNTKIRDKSHFEQFYSYHNRLYEQVEPTTATPFSRASLERGAIGAILLYARCVRPKTRAPRYLDYADAIVRARDILIERCTIVEHSSKAEQIRIIEGIFEDIKSKWGFDREHWEKFLLGDEDSILMRWPGKYATADQKRTSFEIPSSLRHVDKSGELVITKQYH
jgi:hypothetical protein